MHEIGMMVRSADRDPCRFEPPRKRLLKKAVFGPNCAGDSGTRLRHRGHRIASSRGIFVSLGDRLDRRLGMFYQPMVPR